MFLLGSCSALLSGNDGEEDDASEEVEATETEAEELTEAETEVETEIETETETETEIEIETETEVFDPADYTSDLAYDDLARYPEEHIFKAVTYEGKILQVISDGDLTQARLAINDDIDQTVFIQFEDGVIEERGRVLEDDYIRIYGTYLGVTQYQTVLGATREIPAILVGNFEML